MIHGFQTRELRISINGINYYYNSKVYGELYAIVIHRFQKELDTSSPPSRCVSKLYPIFDCRKSVNYEYLRFCDKLKMSPNAFSFFLS